MEGRRGRVDDQEGNGKRNTRKQEKKERKNLMGYVATPNNKYNMNYTHHGTHSPQEFQVLSS